MTSPVFQFEKIKGGYGETEIIHGISGAVEAGQTLGIFGRNGVGKTTLVKLLSGTLKSTSGSVNHKGQEISSLKGHARRTHGIGYLPQTGMVFDGLTVRENLSLANSKRSIDPYFDLFPRLAERQDQLAGSMSGGERKILGFVRTMLEDTSVIILDEPSEGVQPENILNMQTCIDRRKSEGAAFILVEQNLTMLIALSDQYLGIESGRVTYENTKEESSRDELLVVLSV